MEEQEDNPLSGKSHFFGMVVARGEAGVVIVQSGSTVLQARLPTDPPVMPIVPGSWVNVEMDLATGDRQIMGCCSPYYRTYCLEDGTFLVCSPATLYYDDNMYEDDKVAYTPFFRFVDDPKGLLQPADPMEWYEVLLTASEGGAYKLKVDKIVRHMAGCVEPGSMPGMMPTNDQIARAIADDKPENNWENVKTVTSTLLGLCIGHVSYNRLRDPETGIFSNYGEKPSWMAQQNRDKNSRRDWRSTGVGEGIGARRENEDVRTVTAALLVTQRGLCVSMRESESYQRGEWIIFDKAQKTALAIEETKKGRFSYPPYIDQHRLYPEKSAAKTRFGKRTHDHDWRVQVLLAVQFGWLRKEKFCYPWLFNDIVCSRKWSREAKRRLEKEKLGWATMSDEEKDAVDVNVWVGFGRVFTVKLDEMDPPIPKEYQWEVLDLAAGTDFIVDIEMDMVNAHLQNASI